MSRRSARLVSGGYYQSDDDSDSSSVTNISYRESPVRVFKKKAVNRKASAQPNSRASSRASSTSAAPVTAEQYNVDDDITSCLTPALQNSETQHTMRTVPYSATTATPRPALTPAPARSKTPTRCPSVPPEQSHAAGLYRQHRPHHLEPNQSNIDSSGYSSSEGHYRRATANSISSDVPITGRKSSSSSHTSSLSLVIAAAQSRIMLLTDLANTSLTTGMKKALGLLLFLLITILSIWFLLPLLTSLIYRTTITTTPIPTTTKSQPVPPAIPPPPQPNAMHPAPVVDPAIVSAVVEEKMQRLLGEVLLKQDTLYSQMEERVQMEVQDMRAKLEAVTDSRLRLGKEAAGLSRQVADYLTASRSDAASLILRIQALEAKNAKLSQELSSIQMSPPTAPCPDPSTASPHNQLTPELQQALERWLTDHIKQEQQNRSRLSGKESCSDCGRPMADNMADFALESQGASVISTRCSETYRTRSACVTLFGFPLWYPSESPRTVIQGFPVLLPGKCWAFHGVQGTLVLSLSHPIRITHVTLDHLRRSNAPTGRIDSAPKDFEVYGMMEDTEEGSLLGRFTYDQDGESTQTFQLPSPSDAVHRFVELRILSNWGLVEYTCVYRFRVHGKIAST